MIEVAKTDVWSHWITLSARFVRRATQDCERIRAMIRRDFTFRFFHAGICSSSTTLKSLGPGVITGAADDDPSGIATYSVAGAQLGTKLLWTALLTWPLMAAVQMMCARIGKVTGQGLAANFKQRFPRWLLLGV